MPTSPQNYNDVCSAFSNVRTIQALALWAGVASVLFPLLVMLAGAVCKANRNLLLRIFAPGLYISNVVVSLLVIVQGVVLMGTIYYGEPALLGRIHYGYILRFGFAALAGAFYIIRAMFGLVKRAKTPGRRPFAQGGRIPSTMAVRERVSAENRD